jgi:hypothetical protein
MISGLVGVKRLSADSADYADLKRTTVNPQEQTKVSVNLRNLWMDLHSGLLLDYY